MGLPTFRLGNLSGGCGAGGTLTSEGIGSGVGTLTSGVLTSGTSEGIGSGVGSFSGATGISDIIFIFNYFLS